MHRICYSPNIHIPSIYHTLCHTIVLTHTLDLQTYCTQSAKLCASIFIRYLNELDLWFLVNQEEDQDCYINYVHTGDIQSHPIGGEFVPADRLDLQCICLPGYELSKNNFNCFYVILDFLIITILYKKN